MIQILYSLIAAFVATTLVFSVVCLTSSQKHDYDTVTAKAMNLLFGFSTRKAIRANIKPERQRTAIGWFVAREVLFIAVLVVATLEYFMRGG